MYLMGTHIPIYVEGDRTWVDNSWYSDLDLQRQFFSERFGPIHVLGPSLPREEAGETLLTEVPGDDPTLRLHPSFDARTRIRQYWPEARNRWRADLAPLLAEAEVVHASVDDPFVPMQLGLKCDIPRDRDAITAVTATCDETRRRYRFKWPKELIAIYKCILT